MPVRIGVGKRRAGTLKDSLQDSLLLRRMNSHVVSHPMAKSFILPKDSPTNDIIFHAVANKRKLL